MVKLTLTTISLFLAFSVSALDLPKYKVESECKKIASFGGEYSSTMSNGCIKIEQQQYNSIKLQWSSIPDGIKKQCHEIATFGGGGSYQMLGGCIQQELNAEKNKESFTF